MKRIFSRIHHEPGEIVIARIFNPWEDKDATGKPRPAMILAPGDCQHWVIGLTSQSHYKTTGEPRIRVPNPAACGLHGDGYIWSPRPVRCSRIDLGNHIGWADNELASVIANMADADWNTIDRMLDAVARRTLGGHHGLAF
jgi:hypothetical protein